MARTGASNTGRVRGFGSMRARVEKHGDEKMEVIIVFQEHLRYLIPVLPSTFYLH